MNPEDFFSRALKNQGKKNEEPMHGDGFTMRNANQYGGPSGRGVEFRPGESSGTDDLQEGDQQENRSEVEHALALLDSMLQIKNPYTETLSISRGGKFNKGERMDGQSMYFDLCDTPTDLYRIAAEIQKTHPEYHFSFETDPEGKWMKYIVSKDASNK